MKKSLVLSALFITLILATMFVSAKFASETEAVSTGYQCLINSTNKTTLSLEESIFTMLAVGYHNLSNATIGSQKSSSENCWPAASCTLERTGQVGLVYDSLLKNTTGIQNWLYTKNATANGIDWFLEIDIENQLSASCSIKDNTGDSNTISVSAEQKLSGTPGTCFSFARDGYLLGINQNCLDRTFEVKCDENFLTAVLYKKTTSETYYVSGETHTSVAEGTTSEKVTSKCFKNGANCDYKGTLWAALALQHFGRDVTEFIPYIIALSDEDVNTEFFPSAFIYMLTESDDAYNTITQSQQQGKFWRASANNSRLYDTSLGMLSLQGSAAQELSKAKSYLLEIQESNGCWNNKNIRDTAFVLYAGWSQPSGTFNTGDGHTPIIILPNGTTNTGRTQCELSGFSCSSAFACLDAGGVMKNEFTCSGALECCSVKTPDKQTCSVQNGIVCSSNQRCEGRTGASSTGTCCFGSCIAIPAGSSDDTNICESGSYGACQAACGSDQYDSGFSCATPGYLCCSSSSSSSTTEGGSKVWLIFLLGILIIVAVLGIVYKDKLKIWWFKMMNKNKTDKPSNPGTLMPRPNAMIPRRLPSFGGFNTRPPQRPAVRTPVRPTNANTKNKEYEDTLKKLREMSK